MGRWRRGRRDERGAAAVEFALIVPLLALLLFAIVSYGYMLSFRQAISQGAAEGARSAAVAPPGSSDEEVRAAARGRVTEALDAYGVSCADDGTLRHRGDTGAAGECSVTLAPCPEDTARDCVLVDVDYDYADHSLLPVVPGIGLVLPDHLDYTAVVEVN